MPDRNEPTAATAAEGSDWLTAHRDDREIRLTVAQIRHGLHPWSAALAALSDVAGVGAVRRTGGDQFVAGPLPLSVLGQDGAEPGAVLTWDGTRWAPAVPPDPHGASDAGPPRPVPSRRVIMCAARSIVVGPGECGAVLLLTAADEVTLSLPASLPEGRELEVIQAGEGRCRFVASPGAVLANRLGHARTAGRHARASLLLTAGRDGGAAVWTLSGDTGP
jgi:hypothetical protein